MLLLYPYAITQATGSETNNVGNEIVKNLLNIKLWIKMIFSFAWQIVNHLTYFPWQALPIVCSVVLFITIVVICTKIIKKQVVFNMDLVWIAGSAIFTFLAIAFIGGHYVYLRYAYNIVPLLYVVLTVFIENCIQHSFNRKTVCMISLIIAIVSAMYGYANNKSAYLYHGKAEKDQILQEYHDKELIVFYKFVSTAIPTDSFMSFKQFDSLYMDTKDRIEENHIFKNCMNEHNDCVIFLPVTNSWMSGFDTNEIINGLFENTEYDLHYKKVTETGFGEFYYIFRS